MGIGRMWHRKGPIVAVGVVVGSLVSPAGAQPVDSFGRNVPVASMVERVVPPEWRGQVRVEGEAVARRPVSWQPGPDWRTVVRTAVSRVGLEMAEESEGRFVIRERPRNAAAASSREASRGGGAGGVPAERALPREEVPLPPPPAPSETSGRPPQGSGEGAGRSAGAREAAREARPVARSEGQWRARRGQTLEQALAEWAARAGWTLVYNTNVIHDIQADFVFSGEFIEAASSLITAIEARPVPRAVFYRGNRVLVISTSMEDVR